jgi:integrase
MPRVKSDYVPAYRQHRPTGRAVVTLDGRDFYLGTFGTRASKEEYDRLIAEWLANGRQLPGRPADLTVAELIGQYWHHVESYYRHPDGTPTGEVQAMRYALRPLNHLYGTTPVRDFDPASLKTVRELMIRGYDHPRYGPQPALCRNQVNARVKRIRRAIKWGVETGIVSADVLHGLQAVAPLKRGRTEARESEPVKPVPRTVVEDTLPLLRPMQADMVRLMLESGMRPGELVVMRACDIDMTGNVWLYKPTSHKTSHHGHDRVIALGPKCQEIIRRYLVPDTREYLFSPAKNMAERSETLRANRKSKVQPSQQDRRQRRPGRRPGNVYTVTTWSHSLTHAIRRYNAGKPEAQQIPCWHLHQLRHLRALELKREFGLDVARAVLGHRSPVVSELYAGLDLGAAAAAMQKIG